MTSRRPTRPSARGRAFKPRPPEPNRAQAALTRSLQQAWAWYANAEWDKAEQSCRAMLAAHADHFDALTLLGIIAAQTRRPTEAAALLGRAAARRPDDAAASNNYGNVLRELKRLDDALASYERALALKPDYAEAHYNRGLALQELKRLDDALASYERALALKPDYAVACNNRGVTLHELGRLDDALASYERALVLKPDYAEALNNRGNALRAHRRFEQALDSYDRALLINPEYADAHNGRGVVLQHLQRLEGALASFERALAIKPDYAEAHHNRGNALRDLGRPERALESYERALAIKPDYAEAHKNCGAALHELKRFDAALSCYERVLALKPDYQWLSGILLHLRMQLCDWREFDAAIAQLGGKIERLECATPPFPMVALTQSPALQRQAAQTWVRETCPENALLPPIGKRDRHARIRLGYYSADFYNHATASLAAGLFEQHDRERFELVGFHFGPATGDDMTTRLRSAFDRFIDVRTKSDPEVARISRDLEIDIAVDMKGFTQSQRAGIFAHRAAPLQVNYLGYPGTMGAPYIDYLVADVTLIPEASRGHYSEKIVYLPHSYQVNDRTRAIADRPVSRVELLLPPSGFVFCCFNNAYKITPQTFDGWMRILRSVQHSVLWLLEDGETASRNLRQAAEASGVSPSRLVFAQRAPLPEHLARHRAADLFIDTLPCNAHTTASDALWAGLPVLTCLGESFAGRVAASLLNALELPELISTTPAQYEAAAIELATNPARLAALRARLDRNRRTAPLFDTELFTRHLEEAYAQMYERYQADLPPEHLHIAP